MKKTIIIGFVLFFMAIVAAQADIKEEWFDGAEIESADEEINKGPVRVVSYSWNTDGSDKNIIILFDDGSAVRASGRYDPAVVAAMGSASLAEDINITMVYDTYGQFIGIKLQRVDWIVICRHVVVKRRHVLGLVVICRHGNNQGRIEAQG